MHFVDILDRTLMTVRCIMLCTCFVEKMLSSYVLFTVFRRIHEAFTVVDTLGCGKLNCQDVSLCHCVIMLGWVAYVQTF